MSYSQTKLGRRFRNGKTGSASNVKVEEDRDGGLKMVGYGHALYAYRYPDGYTIFFEGWNGRSQSTNQHLSKTGVSTNYDKAVSKRVKSAGFDPRKYREQPEIESPLGT
jgi:hypothetical protein